MKFSQSSEVLLMSDLLPEKTALSEEFYALTHANLVLNYELAEAKQRGAGAVRSGVSSLHGEGQGNGPRSA
jgi:hypothetical protein